MTAQISWSTGLRSGLFGGHSLDPRKFGVSWRSSSTVARAQRGVPVHCPAGTKSLPADILNAYCWQQDDVTMTSWISIEDVSKRYNPDITRISCFVTTIWNYRMHCWFFQQLNICKGIVSVCNSERIIKIWQYLRKLCSNKKGPVFYNSQCISVGLS